VAVLTVVVYVAQKARANDRDGSMARKQLSGWQSWGGGEGGALVVTACVIVWMVGGVVGNAWVVV
jgi:hypothetical protein